MISRTQEDFIWGAVIGGAIAAGIALLLAPTSGKEARKKVINGFSGLNGKKTHTRSHADTHAHHHNGHNGTHASHARPKKAAPKRASSGHKKA